MFARISSNHISKNIAKEHVSLKHLLHVFFMVGPKETKIPPAIYFLFVPQSFLKVLYLIP